MADPTTPLETPRTQALIQRLLDDAVPVRRLWRPSARLALWLAGLVAIGVAAGFSGVRADLGAKLHEPGFVLELVVFALAGAILGARAWQEAVPGYEAGRVTRGLAVVLVTAAAVLWLRQPMHANPAVTGFFTGIKCTEKTLVLAALPWCALLVGIRRGAPLAPTRAGLLAGAAAFSTGALLVRLGCGMDERLHLLVWHGLPLVMGTAVSGVIGLAWLGRWRTAAARRP